MCKTKYQQFCTNLAHILAQRPPRERRPSRDFGKYSICSILKGGCFQMFISRDSRCFCGYRGCQCQKRTTPLLGQPPSSTPILEASECRKWGFKRWGIKQIRGYLRLFPLFSGFCSSRPLQNRAKKAEKGRKRPISTDFQEGRPDTP